jgi:hypothetical protein
MSTIDVDNMRPEEENPLLSVHSIINSKQAQTRTLSKKLKAKRNKQYVTKQEHAGLKLWVHGLEATFDKNKRSKTQKDQ